MSSNKTIGHSRPAVERFTLIAAHMKRGSYSAKRLAEEFEVCVDTVRRDVQFMRDRLQMPFVYDRFTQKWSVDKKAKLPWFWL